MGNIPKPKEVMVLFSRVSVQPGPMAKEINPNAPPGVFQLFNENRTFYFESDISSLPNPPCTLPSSSATQTATISKSWKSLSQPNLSVATTHPTASVSKPSAVLTPANLHLPAAIMAPTTTHSHFHSHHHHTHSDAGALEGRYETDPSYNRSGILRSFKHELHLFGNAVPQKSLSNPSTPRRGSSPDLRVDNVDEENRPRANSDPRKLSLVPEESGQERERSDSRVALAVPLSQPSDAGCAGERHRPLSSDAAYRGRATSPSLQLTQKVIDWFNSPQPQVEVNKQELNAFSPSSF